MRTQPSQAAPNHRVAMIGARGVGKSSIVSQFMTSEGINAYDRQNGKRKKEALDDIREIPEYSLYLDLYTFQKWKERKL